MVDIGKISTFVRSSAQPASLATQNADCLIVDIACLILGIQLSGEVGLEFQGRVRNAASPIVFVTANATEWQLLLRVSGSRLLEAK